MSFPPSDYGLREAVRSQALVAALPAYIRERRWFGGKSREITACSIADALPLPANAPLAYLCVVEISYADGGSDSYLLPLASADGVQAAELRRTTPQAVVMTTDDLSGDGALYDAVYDPAFCQLLLGIVERGERAGGAIGTLLAEPTAAFAGLRGVGELEPRISLAEQSNTSIIYGDRLILKLFRRLVPGLNPDLEIGRFLTEQGQFIQIAPVAGSLSYASGDNETATLGVLMGYVPNVGDAWSRMLELLREVPEHASPADLTIIAARTLGQRTAEMHMALANSQEPSFAPEPFSMPHAEAEMAAMNALADRVFVEARAHHGNQPASVQHTVAEVLAREPQIRARFARLTAQPLTGQRTRAHGDYHLGQVLATPDADFIVIDFEGEPARSLDERRAKRSPLRDVAGMLRSFDYVAATGLPDEAAPGWVATVSQAFLDSYLKTASDASFLPHNEAERAALLDAYLIEKAVYELQYELNNRLDWVRIPAGGILRLL